MRCIKCNTEHRPWENCPVAVIQSEITGGGKVYLASDKSLEREPLSPRENILQEAIEHVTKNRQATHGNPEQSFSDIAALWSWYKGFDFTPTDVAMMQALLKVARQKTTPTHRDNYVDLAGYASCAGEMAQINQPTTE